MGPVGCLSGPQNGLSERGNGCRASERAERASEGPDEMGTIATGSAGIDRSGVGLIYRY